jgi:hypothetical protein
MSKRINKKGSRNGEGSYDGITVAIQTGTEYGR